MSERFAGQCQCGALRYEVRGQSACLFACHCRECQRQPGSAFGLALWVRDPQLTLEGDTLREWVRETPSGKQMACRFCAQCGTRLFHQMLGQHGVLSIKPGTLDDPTVLPVVGHIWTSSRQRWFELPPDQLQYEGNPPGYEALLAAWAELHPA